MAAELTVIAWSVILLLVYIGAQGFLSTLNLGVAYNLSSRDGGHTPGLHAQRARRAVQNLLETYPAFVALALALVIANKAGGIGAVGAWLWLIARAAYLPIYIIGIPVIRSLAWIVSLAGLLMMLARLVG